ncbi:hypothetical protein GM418_10850 [Maribellus comscasis]|uniref:Uncharacterized protein n=1 Tax=Maribellus comscasis TaxID=2681766 RepID=A0A6I6JST2_9BACT|nr:hypothetical protein [Maribellus comscasis]QGY44138.1 hypothetical protein GM418_10850 [Maribellus comscasis]
MNNVLTAEMPDNNNLSGAKMREAKKRMVNEMGLQEYLNSYERYLNKQWLTNDEIQKEMDCVRWETIAEIQKSYQYN